MNSLKEIMRSKEIHKQDTLMEITERVCEVLNSRDMTPKDLSVKMANTVIYKYFTGEKEITLDALIEILYFLKLDLVVYFEIVKGYK